jgi:hypothetical protein
MSLLGKMAPAANAVAVTPDDDTDLTTAADALYIGTTGDLSVITIGGDTVTFANVPAGMVLPVSVLRVKATNTTASDIVAIR